MVHAVARVFRFGVVYAVAHEPTVIMGVDIPVLAVRGPAVKIHGHAVLRVRCARDLAIFKDDAVHVVRPRGGVRADGRGGAVQDAAVTHGRVPHGRKHDPVVRGVPDDQALQQQVLGVGRLGADEQVRKAFPVRAHGLDPVRAAVDPAVPERTVVHTEELDRVPRNIMDIHILKQEIAGEQHGVKGRAARAEDVDPVFHVADLHVFETHVVDSCLGVITADKNGKAAEIRGTRADISDQAIAHGDIPRVRPVLRADHKAPAGGNGSEFQLLQNPMADAGQIKAGVRPARGDHRTRPLAVGGNHSGIALFSSAGYVKTFRVFVGPAAIEQQPLTCGKFVFRGSCQRFPRKRGRSSLVPVVSVFGVDVVRSRRFCAKSSKPRRRERRRKQCEQQTKNRSCRNRRFHNRASLPRMRRQ